MDAKSVSGLTYNVFIFLCYVLLTRYLQKTWIDSGYNLMFYLSTLTPLCNYKKIKNLEGYLNQCNNLYQEQ